jgi:SAM-dependent methyltransferase
LRRAKHRFPEKSSVLEVGFGNGAFLSFSQERRWDIYGVEINEALVNVALDRGFSVALAGDLGGFKDDSFDLIVAFDVLEHIHQDALSEFFKDIKRVLRPGGFFLARFPNGDSPFGLINQNGDVTHITAIGSGKAHYYAAKYDLKIVFIGGEAQPLTGLKFTSLVRLSLTLPLRKLINWCVCMVFFSRSNVAFTSTNLTVIFKKLLS